MRGLEKSRTFFGLSELQLNAQLNWNAARSELSFELDNRRKSNVPSQPPTLSQKKNGEQNKQNIVQIIWVDREIKITRQPHSDINQPDLYTLWKRANSNIKKMDNSIKFY